MNIMAYICLIGLFIAIVWLEIVKKIDEKKEEKRENEREKELLKEKEFREFRINWYKSLTPTERIKFNKEIKRLKEETR